MTAKIGSMTRRRWTVRLASLAAAVAICSARLATAQQTSWSVSNAGDLTTALAGAFNNNVTDPGVVTTITLTGSISGTSQWIVNANVNIVGNGYTIDMQNADRAFFIAGGTVGMSNLSITNGNAAGGSGGGGGAGLGGAIFVGSGIYYGGVNPVSGSATIAAQGLSAPVVSLSSVTFSGNQAVGGAGSAGSGGGMGGNGSQSGGDNTGQGGGGFGAGANGGAGGLSGNNGSPGSAGAFVNVGAVGGASLSGGAGGNGSSTNGGPGGANGGGGGGGGLASFGYPGTGGGGGVAAGRGYFGNSDSPNNGGNGGFGGGGGSNWGSYGSGGNGGFGGGGGSGSLDGGTGGFGGGGGGAGPSYALGQGGFGAANAQSDGDAGNGIGGGGLGAGGALFVMPGATVTVQNGTFSGNSVAGGTTISSNQGSAYGTDVFLGANVTFDVATNLSVSSLGGAGNLADPNVVKNANDPNAQGGIIKTGNGTLTLTGTSYYSGITTVNSGTLALAPSATEQGTTLVTVGQNPGDVATLGLGSSSTLTLGGFNGASGTDAPVVIAQAAGSTGTVVIGNGAGSNGADIGARVFTGGAGNASVVFTQQYWAAGTNPVYPFYTSLTGSLGIVQNGLGTTSLQPLYGANTFTGPVTVNVGTLETTGTAAALAGATSITVNAEGALLLGQTNGVNDSAAVTLAGGELFTGTSLSETFGALNVTVGGWSIINFMGNSSTLNFSSLSLDGSLASLAILNYDGANDFLNIASGTATGSLSRIAFYSDSGSTLLGYGGFEGTRLVPVAVPEPSTVAMALAGLGCGGYVVRRRRKRD